MNKRPQRDRPSPKHRLRVICRAVILESLLGNLQAFVLDALHGGIPNALYERPRKRTNVIDAFAAKLS
jgi:hypothetical protein